MTAHRQRMHGTEPTIDWSRLLVSHMEHQPQVHNVRFSRSTKQYPCSFPRFPWSYHTWNGLRSHFICHYCGDRIRVLEEHPNRLPMYECCKIQLPAGRISTCRSASDKFKQVEDRRIRPETLKHCFEASKVLFQINSETLPSSEAFPYLGRTIAYNKSDWVEVYQNLQKAQRRWVMVSRVL